MIITVYFSNILGFQDDQYSTNIPMSNDISRKRSLNQEYEDSTNSLQTKRGRYAFEGHVAPSIQKDKYDQHSVPVNGAPPSAPIIQGNLTPVEQMVAMICALLAEGDRGAESLDILISNIHPDLLADIVINNMKHLPKAVPDVARLTKLPVAHQIGSLHNLSQTAPTDSPTYPVPSSQVPVPSPSAVITPPIDLLTPTCAPADFRRDPRRVQYHIRFVSKLSFTMVIMVAVLFIFCFSGSPSYGSSPRARPN